MMSEFKIRVESAIARVDLNRTGKRNSIARNMMFEYAGALLALRR